MPESASSEILLKLSKSARRLVAVNEVFAAARAAKSAAIGI
jgi:hypothetical protein